MPYPLHQGSFARPRDKAPLHVLALPSDQRHLRRKLLHLPDDDVVMLDLKEAVMLADGDVLLLDTGEYVEIGAVEEPLYAVTARDPLHLTELAWHLGNRHLQVEIGEGRILIQRDPVIRAMLLGLGAAVEEITAASTRCAVPITAMAATTTAGTAMRMGATRMPITLSTIIRHTMITAPAPATGRMNIAMGEAAPPSQPRTAAYAGEGSAQALVRPGSLAFTGLPGRRLRLFGRAGTGNSQRGDPQQREGD